MPEMTRNFRRHSAPEMSARKRGILVELAQRMATARDAYVAEYSRPGYLAELFEPGALRRRARRSGWVEPTLGAHQNALALDSSIALLRSHWRRTFARVRTLVGKNARLTDGERRWIYAVLRRPDLVQRCLQREPVLLGEGTAEVVEERLAYRVRRMVLRYRTGLPTSRSLWFDIDTNLYRPFAREDARLAAWLALTGLQKGQRLAIPLAGRDLKHLGPRTEGRHSWPGLRVHVGKRVTFSGIERVTAYRRPGEIAAGIDKGFTTLLTVSLGDPRNVSTYGSEARLAIAAIADSAEERLRDRHRLAAYERSLRNSRSHADRTRARRIRRNNLRGARRDRRARRDKALLRDHVNRALNEMFRGEQQAATLVVEDLSFRGRRRLSRPTNRHLGRWLKGFLQRRLAYKAERNGVALHVVNAAYTSQTCPACWFASAKNRRRERFECASCGYTGSADAVAATNVLRRGSDPAVTRFMPKDRVKQILDERWRSARAGRAWGSNEGPPLRDVGTEPRSGESREQGPGTPDTFHACGSHPRGGPDPSRLH